jgi:HD-GYP domain-containing protein (c-di-GMP phosphodiesterase class II)
LRGEQTRLEARIIAVADVVEAMGHHRPYRPALGLDRALAHLSQEAGRLYDPAVVEATSRAFQEGGFEFRVG